MKKGLLLLVVSFLVSRPGAAQFLDDFNETSIKMDPEGITGWTFSPGDGTATMDFRQGGEGYASIFVDATHDKRGIWWALI